MTYLDNAATTFPKPACVKEAMGRALQQYGANPGRGGHDMSMATSRAVYLCRETAARFFHFDNPSGVIFTLNCTMAINIALKGILSDGGRVIVSDLEHNAVMRPLFALSPKQPNYDVAQVTPGDDAKTVEAFRRCITPSTKAIVCTHASNVFGVRLPIEQLGALAHRNGLLFVVDTAQSAGIFPIDIQAANIDFLCVAGHKGLYGPMGTGMLLCNCNRILSTLVEGGTGSQSLRLEQPEDLPDRFESGTPNTAGICGLRAGMEWVMNKGVKEIAKREMEHLTFAYDRLSREKTITLYTPRPDLTWSAPVLSFNMNDQPSEKVAARLNQHGIAVRAGLHCAPCAHRRFGTLQTGTVRISPSAFTTSAEMERACKIILQCARKPLQ